MLVILIVASTVIGISFANDAPMEPVETVDPEFVVIPDVETMPTNKPLPDDSCVNDSVIPPVETKPSVEDVPANTEPSKPYYTVTEAEREMLARVTFLESGICSQECQRMIVSVIFNRLDSGRWKKDMNGDNKITLYDIVYYPAAFSPVAAGKMSTAVPSQSCYDAVDYVIQNGPTLPTYIRYFRAGYHFSNKAKGWETYLGYCDLDNVYFGYFSDWETGRW